MADPGFDVTSLLAPWMQQNPLDPSNYGGQGQFGAAMLAGAGPTPYRVPFGVALGKAMQAGQANALQNAQQRMGLAGNSIALQQQMAFMPLISQIMQRMAGRGQPSLAQNPTASAAPSAALAASGTPGASNDQPAAQGATQDQAGPPTSAAPAAPQAPWMGNSSGMDPLEESQLGALAGMVGMRGAEGMQKDASLKLQYDPSVAAGLAQAKDPMTQDLLGFSQASRAGNQDLASMYYNKLRQDAGALQVARNSGIRQELLPNGQWSMFNPENMTQGIGNNIAPIPGATATKEALAGAAARGEAQGQLEEVTLKDGSKVFVPKASLLGGAAPRATATTPAAPGAPAPAGGGAPVAALGPQQERFLGKRGTEAADYLTELQKSAEGARDTNYSLDQMIEASRGVVLGPGAPTRAFFENNFSKLGNLFGVSPSGELGNYQALDKYANKVGFAAARAMGSREAAQIVTMAIQSNPNKAMVPEAFSDIALSMKGLNNYVIDKNAFLQGSGENSQGAAAKWTQNVDPRVWSLTLSPAMGQKWAKTLGKESIVEAYKYMQPAERAALLQNIPVDVRKQWLAQ